MTHGVSGYSESIEEYILASQKTPFEVLHKDFLPFIPSSKSKIIDLGAGFGRDAFELSQRGHSVLAVEPLADFRKVGQEMYSSENILWVDDSLPHLKRLEKHYESFDFALSSGVWHHLNTQDQLTAIERVSGLIKPGGILALLLRNGPSGLDTHIFPTDADSIANCAINSGFELKLELRDQPSLLKNKENVKWTRLVLLKKE